MREAVVVEHFQTIPSELVVEKLVGQVELQTKEEEVKKFTLEYKYQIIVKHLYILTENKRSKVPGIMVKDCLEIFDKLLHHDLLHHSVIILGILADHDGGLALCTK